MVGAGVIVGSDTCVGIIVGSDTCVSVVVGSRDCPCPQLDNTRLITKTKIIVVLVFIGFSLSYTGFTCQRKDELSNFEMVQQASQRCALYASGHWLVGRDQAALPELARAATPFQPSLSQTRGKVVVLFYLLLTT
jgi:hypothetical protein